MLVQNTADHPFDIYSIPTGVGPNGVALGSKMYSVPRLTVDEKGRHPGVVEIPDDVLAELLAKDPWTKGCFDSGDLVAVSSPESKVPASERVLAATGATLASVGTNTAEGRVAKGGK